ncbi:MAG: hypothetical protein NTV86_17570, partial [Planctomycetota bacterium]|nr:hypothetical protein [Planctomycetota bacterium]
MTLSPRSWLAASLVLFVAVSALRGDAQADFDSIYGDQVKKAAASGNKKDSLALAEKLLKTAKELQDAPALRIVMLEKAVELGLQAPAGYETVEAAIDTLNTVAPERGVEWQAKRLQILLGRYQNARPDEKASAADEYVAALIAVADEEVEAGQVDQAIAHYKQAMSSAASFHSAVKTDIAARIRTAEARREIAKQQKQLQDKLTAAPADAPTRQKLVRLLVLDLDAPEKAVPFLNDDIDQATKTYAPLAVKEVDSVEEKIALEMGRWYESMLQDPAFPEVSAAAARTALERARGYYRRYLDLHTAKDADGLKASMAAKRVDDEAKRRGIVWAKEKLVFSDPKVADVVKRACKYIWAAQHPDGVWPDYMVWEAKHLVSAGYGVCTTALPTFALLETGADAKSAGMSKALRWLGDQKTGKTYCLAYRAAALASLDATVRAHYLARLRDDARLLTVGGVPGNYTYDCTGGPRQRRLWDNSNSQYGVLGMAFADEAGLAAPRGYWLAVMKHWQACQNDDGG